MGLWAARLHISTNCLQVRTRAPLHMAGNSRHMWQCPASRDLSPLPFTCSTCSTTAAAMRTALPAGGVWTQGTVGRRAAAAMDLWPHHSFK